MSNIVNGLGQVKVGVRIASGGGGGIDTDAQAFITAANITDTTQQNAINTLVTQLKTYGIWTKLKAVYPFVGGTASSHKFNLKDPRDLDAAYRLVFNGGWTHSSNGVTPNGTTGYANPNYINVTDNSSIWYYSRTNNTANSVEMGVYNNPWSDTQIDCNYGGTSGGYIRAASNGYTGLGWISTTSQGFYGANRTSSILANSWYNGVKKGTNTNTSSQDAFTKTLFIGAYNSNTGAIYFSNRESAFASIGDGLTDTEAANFYTAVQAYQTTLGRQVGVPIVADSDAQAFLNAAVITDSTQASAINTLVTDLKTANIWTKMRALYPFVGGTATAHKFNLKDPRDLDAAYRLVFAGGWTHSSTGALPNGTTGYADTKLIPSTNLLTDSHISIYLNTVSSNDPYPYVMGSSNGETQALAIRTFGNFDNTSRMYNYSMMSSANNISTSNGFWVSNIISGQSRALRNNSLRSYDLKSGTSPTVNMFIGAINANNVAYNYASQSTCLVSMGDALNSTEETAFYTAVQKYQTTLGRQV
jgi:hypothetical protein